MTIAQIIENLTEKHVALDPAEPTVDGVICGDISAECTGIVLTCAPTAEVIQKAADIGSNLIICHEPTFFYGYDETDWLEGTNVYEAKRELIEKYHMVIFRDHDRTHSEQPDMIYYGIVKKLGWENYKVNEGFFPVAEFTVPQTTLEQLGYEVAQKLNIDGLRVVGDLNMPVRNVALMAHFLGHEEDKTGILGIDRNDYDVVIPLEIIDWTITEYIMDSTALGHPRGMLNVGHFNLEEAGVEMMADWIRSEIVGQAVPVTFIQSGNMYRWLERPKQ